MATHTRQADLRTETFAWGSIKWSVTGEHFPGAPLTLGEVVINPTKGHDRHTHPESDEVLHVLEGTGMQTVGDSGEFEVGAGDSIVVPRGTEHSTFNTGWRQMRLLAIYMPGGAEEALKGDPDYRVLEPGVAPVWERAAD